MSFWVIQRIAIRQVSSPKPTRNARFHRSTELEAEHGAADELDEVEERVQL